MKILVVCSEVHPFSKTGGLADVISALPCALAGLGAEVVVTTPYYPREISKRRELSGSIDEVYSLDIEWGEETKVTRVFASMLDAKGDASSAKVPIWLIREDGFFDREGIYGPPNAAYEDNLERFAFFTWASLQYCARTGFVPDLVHLHDWQTCLVPAQLACIRKHDSRFAGVKTVLTIHNLAFQGLCQLEDLESLPFVPRGWLTRGTYEIWGQTNPLKGAIIKADAITTVSPTYAGEILEEERGFGLHGLLSDCPSGVIGILNGVDYGVWNPSTDSYLIKNYDTGNLDGKRACRAHIVQKGGLKFDEDTPLFTLVSRITTQKGFNILIPALRSLWEQGFDFGFAMLGSGDPSLEADLRELESDFPGKCWLSFGYSEPLSHELEAGGDVFLMPSEFEPCGLNQLYSLKYGTLPVVNATGGLKDSVDDGRTGFVMADYSTDALVDVLERVFNAYSDKAKWQKMIGDAMLEDFSWKRSAIDYMKLFTSLIPEA